MTADLESMRFTADPLADDTVAAALGDATTLDERLARLDVP